MNKVICFGMCDRNYVDPLKVALYSFTLFNSDVELKVFLVDDSKEFFDSIFNYSNVEFINFGKNTKTYTYINQHFDDFKTFQFTFTKTPTSILNVTIANEVTDYMYEHYGKDYQVIMRLDFDVLFGNCITPSIDNFLASGKILGGAGENVGFKQEGFRILKQENPICTDVYLNAGNFMYRTDKMYHDQFDRMCNLFETLGFERFHLFDQDSVNLMYADDDKYDNTKDGYVIPNINCYIYHKLVTEGTAPIFFHYLTAHKPWANNSLYKITLGNAVGFATLSVTFRFYRLVAKCAKCSQYFLETIDKNIALQENIIQKYSTIDRDKCMTFRCLCNMAKLNFDKYGADLNA